jgi:hypothetical protein
MHTGGALQTHVRERLHCTGQDVVSRTAPQMGSASGAVWGSNKGGYNGVAVRWYVQEGAVIDACSEHHDGHAVPLLRAPGGSPLQSPRRFCCSCSGRQMQRQRGASLQQ